MKKILYITRYPLSQVFSLKAKFDGQIKAFENLGYDVSYFAYDDKYYYLINKDNKKVVSNVFATKTGLYHHFFAYVILYKSVIKVLKEGHYGKGDFVYMRSMPTEWYGQKMNSLLKSKSITIIKEIPTYIKGGKEKPRFIIRIFKTLFKIFGKDKYTDLYTLIGDPSNGTYNGKPAINIENGVSVSSVAPRTPVFHDGINMLAIASVAYWHGYDRVVEGLRAFANRSDLKFYIVGPDGDGSLERIKQKVKEYGLEHIVHIAGPMYGNELNTMVNNCDLAFASLAIFRKKITTASALKNREYMSRGIPFVYASSDPVLDEHPSPYTYNISNDETPVDIGSVLEFAHTLPNNEIIIKEMRDYASRYMTWEAQFVKMFDFLKIKSVI